MKTIQVPNNVLLPEVRRMIEEGRSVTLKVKGNSMLPFITGDRDSVVLQSPGMLHCGDIVLAEVLPGRFVIHRIIRIAGDSFTLMGDGNILGTETCGREQIAGKVVILIRNGRQVSCDCRSERLAVDVWKVLKPLRRYLLAIYRRIK